MLIEYTDALRHGAFSCIVVGVFVDNSYLDKPPGDLIDTYGSLSPYLTARGIHTHEGARERCCYSNERGFIAHGTLMHVGALLLD